MVQVKATTPFIVQGTLSPVIIYDRYGAQISAGVAQIHLTDAEIDRIIAARDEYHRETKHRGYPVT
jgi:hypothetical protein